MIHLVRSHDIVDNDEELTWDDFNNRLKLLRTKCKDRYKDLPKFFEGIVVDKSKYKLSKACSKFQIGGLPGHRPQEYLFTVKSVIGLYSYLKIIL